MCTPGFIAGRRVVGKRCHAAAAIKRVAANAPTNFFAMLSGLWHQAQASEAALEEDGCAQSRAVFAGHALDIEVTVLSYQIVLFPCVILIRVSISICYGSMAR